MDDANSTCRERLENIRGSMLAVLNGKENAVQGVREGERRMVWREEIAGGTAVGNAPLVVLDVLELAELPEDVELSFLPTCYTKGKYEDVFFSPWWGARKREKEIVPGPRPSHSGVLKIVKGVITTKEA